MSKEEPSVENSLREDAFLNKGEHTPARERPVLGRTPSDVSHMVRMARGEPSEVNERHKLS